MELNSSEKFGLITGDKNHRSLSIYAKLLLHIQKAISQRKIEVRFF